MVRDKKPRTVYWLDDKLYLNITNKCSNKCIFCFRNLKHGVGGFTLKLSKEPSLEQIKLELDEALKRKRWKEVVFCGFGEPTERLDLLLVLSRYIKRRFAEPVAIRVNTNGQGYMLNSGRNVIDEAKAVGVDRVSVSLNAGDEKTYNEVCKPSFVGSYQAVLGFIEKTKTKLNVEVTAVTMPEVDLHKVEDLAKQLSVKFRLRQYIQCFW